MREGSTVQFRNNVNPVVTRTEIYALFVSQDSQGTVVGGVLDGVVLGRARPVGWRLTS